MTTVQIKRPFWKLAGEFPATWKELSQSQYVALCQILLGYSSTHSQQLQILILFFRVQWYTLWRSIKVSRLWPEELEALRSLTEWCYEPISLHEWKIKTLKGYSVQPDGITRWSFGYFIYAYTYFDQWNTNKSPDALNKLMACIFSHNQPLSELDERADTFARASEAEKIAAALNFGALRKDFVERFPAIFSSDNKGKADKYGWVGVLDELSGGKFGNDRETENANVLKIFIHLDRLQQKAAEA